jgi:hypothetical protein
MGASLNPGLSGLFCFGRNSQEGKVSANWGGGLGSPRILQVLPVRARFICVCISKICHVRVEFNRKSHLFQNGRMDLRP